MLALTGCSVSLGEGGSSVHSHQHRTFMGVRYLRVQNVSGPVTINTSHGNAVAVDATLSAGSQGAIDRTHVEYDAHGDSLDVTTHYDRNGWFGNSNGANVDYTVTVPPKTDVEVENISGPIAVTGVLGDVRASQVSGPVRAMLGRIEGSRDVNIKAVSGRIDLSIARNSSATLNAESISGDVRAFFPADEHKGVVGMSIRGRIGSGSGSIDLSTVSGSIDVTSQ
jgi:hypothetical protein